MDHEGAPAPHGAGDADGSTVLLDDAQGHAEAEPRPLADLLGREERIEEPTQVLRRDAASGVAHHDLDPRPRPAVPSRCHGDRGAHADGPSGVRGVQGIEHDVHDDALHLAAVHDELRETRPGLEAKLDALHECLVLHDRERHLDESVDVHRLGLELRLPGEVQEAPHDVAHPRGGAGDDLEVAADVGGEVGAAEQEVGEGEGPRQGVVDLMGHARGEATD